MNNGPYIPERGAGLTPQDFPNLPSGPALGFNSCSLCGHGGTSGSILARIREYVTFYANSDADLSDDMAIGRQEVSKSVMEILNEAEPVPAPRLEWKSGFAPYNAGNFRIWANPDHTHHLNYGSELCGDHLTLDAAKSLAEKLNAVLSPPVGTQKKEN